MDLIYTIQDGTEVYTALGKKSQFDFKVSYREPVRRRGRTPKHIHWIIDLYIKHAHRPEQTMAFVDHLIWLTQRLEPATNYPPELQIFEPSHVHAFADLDEFGPYSVEFLLVVIELIMIQEKTNYPNGTMNLRLLEVFRHKHEDVFAVVSHATFR